MGRNLKWCLVSAAAGIAVVASGCSSSGSSGNTKGASAGGSSPSSASKGGTIAFSYGNESSGIYPIVEKPAKQEAQKRGYKFIEGSANGDCNKQVNDLQNFITQRVSAIVVLPLCGSGALKSTLKQAHDAGIKIVGYSQAVPSGDAAIVYKNVDGANAVAQNAISWYKANFAGDKSKFSWVLFTFDQCGKPCTDRTDPIRTAIIAATGVKPLEAVAADEQTGQKAMETLLQKDPTVNMVIGIDDAAALGAYQTLSQLVKSGTRKGDSLYVAGMDGQLEALQLIAKGGGVGGIYRASGALILDSLGRSVADTAGDLVEGKTAPNSNVQLPYKLITPADAAEASQIVNTYNRLTKK